MKAFAEAWPDESSLQPLVAKLPWGHNVRLLDRVKNREERLWYAGQTLISPPSTTCCAIPTTSGVSA
jgi:predicted nuclease of restriction endonuclease-like (RecB) superfamily